MFDHCSVCSVDRCPPPALGRGFAAVELVFVVAIGVVLVSALLVAGSASRAGAGLNRDLGNLRQIGQWTFMYAADFEGRAPTLSGAPNSQWPVLRPIASRALENGARHAIDIIRRRTGRVEFPVISSGWFAHLMYSHLPLVDYLDRDLPDRTWVATGDVHRMNWTDDPVNKHDLNLWQPFQERPGGMPGQPVAPEVKRWPYSASFSLPPAWYDVGQSNWSSGPARVSQVGRHNRFSVPGSVQLEGAPLSEVAYASAKVLLHDFGDRYHARSPQHFGRSESDGPGARVAMLLADGSAGARATGDANAGWDARLVSSANPTQYTYTPRTWEPPTSNGEPTEQITAGVYRWTRGGILGRDFGGTEIDTGQR